MKNLVKIKNLKSCAFYLCSELNCGFRYCYKRNHGPSKNHPLLCPLVLVVDLNKKVNINLIGWGEEGFEKLINYGYEGYIFPVNLHDKPFRIDPQLSGEEDENWKKLISNIKGESYKTNRKYYILVDDKGSVIKRKLCNEEEFKETLAYQEDWKKRHPDQEPLSWRLEC